MLKMCFELYSNIIPEHIFRTLSWSNKQTELGKDGYALCA